MASSSDSTQRFSTRVRDYVRYRPTYPSEVLTILAEEACLTPEATIADIGSGTGISAKLFLAHGNAVYGVEPNREMRLAAEEQLADFTNFRSVDGRAEATTLSDDSVDMIVAAQAFHWFDHVESRREVARILKSDGWVVLLWNTRRTEATPFLRDYEKLLQDYGTDYDVVQHTKLSENSLRRFYGGDFTTRTLDNQQQFDLEGLQGRLLSSSYAPGVGHPRYKAMLEALAEIFERHAEHNQVVFEYDTELHFGQLGGTGNATK